MKNQNKVPFFRRKGFCKWAIVLASLLLMVDIALGLLPAMPDRGQVPEVPFYMQMAGIQSGMQTPELEQMGDIRSWDGTGQGGSLLQTLKRIWIPIAIALILMDVQFVFLLWRHTRKKKPLEEISTDGEVHLARKEHKTRRYRPWWAIAPVAVVLALVMVVQLFSGTSAEEMPRTEASILSGTAVNTDLDITLPGTGTLTADAAEPVTLVSSVEIRKWYISDGDTVAKGDALAALDRVSVMAAIATVQDTIEQLDDALSGWQNDTLSSRLTAPTAGRIKEIYAQTGDSVADVMYEHGALMRISMDGMMAVSIQTDLDLAAGDAVIVTFTDGAEETGKVESITNATAVITLTDDGPKWGDEVTVTTETGEIVGSGSLYIHSELNVTAYTGTVKSVAVRQEQKISSGSVLLQLRDRVDVASYECLLSQRSRLEKQMEELFQLYQTSTLYAPCDGLVSGVKEYAAANMSSVSTAKLMLLANAPGSDPDAAYVNFVGKVAAVVDGIWQVQLSPESWEITDYGLLPQMDFSDNLLTQSVTYTPSGVPLYARSGGAWVSISASQVKGGDTVLFAFDPEDTSRLVWVVVVSSLADDPPAETEPTPTELPDPDATEPAVPDSTEPAKPSVPSQNQGHGSVGSGMGGALPSGGTQTEQEAAYEVTESQVLTITPCDTMRITITVDELDILSVKVGQTVQVTLDALPGQSFEGVVAEVGLAGSNSGGNSKFVSTIEIPRTTQMLPGMNASVDVMLEQWERVLTVPAAALVEQDGKVYLYTTYDEKSDTLGGLTEVTTGFSDGEKVQILSGIPEGGSFYYSYLDTVNYETGAARSAGMEFSFDRLR